MASWFEETFENLAGPHIQEFLYQDATYYVVGSGAAVTSFAVRVVFNEQVGFVDNRLRAVWTLLRSDLEAEGVTAARGHYFILDGETERWTVVDVRDDKAGMIEVRADSAAGRN